MPIAKTSKQPLRSLKLQSQKTNRGRTTKLGDELVKGLKQAAAHVRGEVKLPSYEYNIPDRVDVRCGARGPVAQPGERLRGTTERVLALQQS